RTRSVRYGIIIIIAIFTTNDNYRRIVRIIKSRVIRIVIIVPVSIRAPWVISIKTIVITVATISSKPICIPVIVIIVVEIRPHITVLHFHAQVAVTVIIIAVIITRIFIFIFYTHIFSLWLLR